MIDFSSAPLNQDQQAPSIDIDAINRHLTATLESWLFNLLPEAKQFPQDIRAGSVRGERGSSLSIARTGPRRGLWQDRASGQSGNPIQLIQASLNTDFQTALQAALRIAELPLQPTPPEKIRQPDPAETLLKVHGILKNTLPLADSIVEQYLVSTRKLSPANQQDIRFHPSLFHYPSQRSYPAMVAIVRHYSGKITGIHRTFLDTTTCDKITTTPARLALGPISGGAVWLHQAAGIQNHPSCIPVSTHNKLTHNTLAVCEGIETGLAILQLFPELSTVAATLSTSGMRNFRAPPHAERILICADRDPVDPHNGHRPGTQAAECLQSRLSCPSVILYPDEPFNDFNDQVKQ